MGFCKPKIPSPQATADATFTSLLKYAPQLFSLLNENVLPAEQARVGAEEAIAPRELALDTQLLKGQGGDLIDTVLSKSKEIDPEFFNSRALVGDNLQRLMDSIDVSGTLSGSESAEIERNLNRMNAGEVPSNLQTVKSGIEFGRAGQAKKLQGQQALTGAIGAGTSFLPASKVGIDPLGVARGRKGVDTAGVSNTIGQALNPIAAAGQQYAGLKANQATGFDKFNEFQSTLPDY